MKEQIKRRWKKNGLFKFLEKSIESRINGSNEKKEERCLNCGVTLQGEYCHHCGQKNKDGCFLYFSSSNGFFKLMKQELIKLKRNIV